MIGLTTKEDHMTTALSVPKIVSVTPEGGQPLVVIAHALLEEVQGLLTASQGLAVTDAMTNEEAGLILSTATTLLNKVEKQRVEVKAPWKAVTDAIDRAPKPVVAVLEAIKTDTKKKMGVYHDKVQAENAAKAAFAPQGAAVEQAAQPKTEFTAVVKVKKWELLPKAAVPADYLVPDEKKIGAAVRAGILTADNAGTWLKVWEENDVRSTGR
jgi:hypothetical protein